MYLAQFLVYFFILKNLATSMLVLITIIPPIIALFIAAFFNDETVSKNLKQAGFYFSDQAQLNRVTKFF